MTQLVPLPILVDLLPNRDHLLVSPLPDRVEQGAALVRDPFERQREGVGRSQGVSVRCVIAIVTPKICERPLTGEDRHHRARDRQVPAPP